MEPNVISKLDEIVPVSRFGRLLPHAEREKQSSPGCFYFRFDQLYQLSLCNNVFFNLVRREPDVTLKKNTSEAYKEFLT